MDVLTRMNLGLAGFFAFAAIHYAIQWWYSRNERVFLVFSLQCVLYTPFCLAITSFFQARTIAESQVALDRFVTLGVLAHAMLLQLYAHLGERRDRGVRAIVTGVLAFLALQNQWAPLRGTVVALQTMRVPGGDTAFLAVRTPPGASLIVLYVTVLAIQGYGFITAHAIWKRDRVGAALIAFASTAILVGAALGFLIDFTKLRAPYAGAWPHVIFVVSVGLYLSREYSARGVRLATSEKRVELALRETQEALANLQAEHQRREEADRARQEALEAFVHAQKAELAGQLAAGAAHDFNNVLGVISTWSAVILDDSRSATNTEAARRALANAQRQGQALARQLMTLARPSARSVTSFPLERAIQTSLQALTPALPRGSELRFEASGSTEVEADEGEIQQVIYNLVLNAGDAMPTGGLIEVNAGLETSSSPIDVVGGSLPAGLWATLTVTDSGPGIAPAIRDRIFNLFFTTKAPGRGSGLGLATVLRIAKMSGGGIAFDSEPGRGATFRLYLPIDRGFRRREVDKKVELSASGASSS